MARGHKGQRGHPPRRDVRPLPGVCPDCDAESDMVRDDLGIWHLTIHHDDTCPTYRKRTP